MLRKITFFVLLFLQLIALESYAQCTTTVDNVFFHCRPENPGVFYVSFRVAGNPNSFNVVDLNGNVPNNMGFFADNIGDGETATTGPVILTAMANEEYRYFGPFANGTTVDVVLIDTDLNPCDTLEVINDSFDCGVRSGVCGSELPFYNLDYNISDIDSFLIIERARGLGCSDSTCVPGNNKRCFEFRVILPDDAIGLTISDAGSGSPGGELYYADENGMDICMDLFDSNPGGDNMMTACVPGSSTFIVMSCKQGGNTTSAVVEVLRRPMAPVVETIEPCDIELGVTNADQVSWSSPNDPDLRNLVSCSMDSTICSFVYDEAFYGPVTACEGDTFYYIIASTAQDTMCLGDSILVDTGYVIVFPVFEVDIQPDCNADPDSLDLAATVLSGAVGCDYDFIWSNGSTDSVITVPIDGAEYFVTVTRGDIDTALQTCVFAVDSALAEIFFAIDCSMLGDSSYQCLSEIPEPDTTLVNNIGCADPGLIYVVDTDNGGAGCTTDPLILTRQYIIDEDGDTITTLDDQDTCTQIFTIIDDTNPLIVMGTCPQDTMVDCSVALPAIGVPEFTDNCTELGNIVIAVVNDTISGFDGSCGQGGVIGVIERQWFASDACGNVDSSCIVTITQIDTTGPVITCPADAIVQCGEPTDEIALGSATAIDACGIAFVSFTDTEIAGECEGEMTILRAWVAVDDCGNSSNCTQTISVVDTVPPFTVFMPNDTIIDCDADIMAVTSVMPIFDDACSGVSVTPASSIMLDPNCPNGQFIQRSWTVVDSCDNVLMVVQNITVQDTSAPEVVMGSCPSDTTLNCTGSTSPDALGFPDFTDNCTAADEIITSFRDDSLGFDGSCINNILGSITRTFFADDGCGNIDSSCVQIITVQDTTAPLLITCPEDVTIECTDVADLSVFGTPTYNDDCTDSLDVVVTVRVDTLSGLDGSCDMQVLGVISRTWFARDNCGNIDSSCVQILTVQDTFAPSPIFGSCPQDTTLDCATGDISGLGMPSYTDNCTDDASILISMRDDTISGFDGACINDTIGLIMRTWFGEDGCGNIDSTCVQFIAFVDTVAPVILFAPQDTVVDCEADVGAIQAIQPVFEDACTGVNVLAISSIAPDPDCPNAFVISRSWTAIDSCGNSVSVGQTITVQDTTAPVVVTCPNDTIVDCLTDISPATLGLPTGMDNCSDPDSLDITFADDSTGFDGICMDGILGVVSRTFFIEDECGNIDSSCVQVISVQDTIGPDFIVPGDITVECGTDLDDLLTLGDVVEVTDQCSEVVDTSYTDAMGINNCDGTGTIVRTWVLTDACDNATSQTQTITIIDTTPPDFNAPADVTIECDQDPTDLTITGNVMDPMDICSMMFIIDFTDDVSGLTGCNNTGVILRTFTVTDECDNSATMTQVITVEDNTPPVAMCMDIGIDFGGETEITITPEDVDNGSFDACGDVTLELSQTTFSCEDFNNVDAIDVTLTVTDECGNTSTCVASVTGQGGSFINIICPQDITVYLEPGECEEIVDYNVSATVLCGDEPVIEQSDMTGFTSGDYFPIGTTTLEYIAFNAFDTASCTFDIIVIEYQNPVDPACNDLVNISLDENCEGIVNADLILEGGPYGCYDDYIITVEGVGTDTGSVFIGPDQIGQLIGVTIVDPDNGNFCWSSIFVEDKIPPVIECIDVTLSCTDDTDPIFSDPVIGVASATVTPGTQIGPNAGSLNAQSLIVNAPADAIVTDVNITIDLVHTFSADLDVFLVGPDGTMVELATDLCGGTDNWSNVTFDDEAASTAAGSCSGVAPALSGVLSPEGLLSDFDNLLANGEWILQITDDAGGDQGILNSVTIEVGYFVPAPYAPVASDACGEVTLTYTEQTTGDMCELIFINRFWVATDESGNTASCIQTITVTPLDLDGVVIPPNFAGSCGGPSDPSVTGYPTIDGAPIVEGGVCNIFAGYWDIEIGDCGGGIKIIRQWTILDWCTQEFVEGNQIIRLTDDEAPVITCPENITVNTDPWFCNRDVVVPQPTAVDACGTPFSFVLNAGALQPQVSGQAPFYVVNDVPLGTHTLTWIVTDACGNSASCTFTITVEDKTPPVASCDEHTVVSLLEDPIYNKGLTKIPATVLDDGSYDNCGPVTFRARRMDSCIDFDWTTNGAGIDEIPNGFVDSRDRGTVHREKIPFACCDVAAGAIMVELEVTDASGNVNYCMVEVEVQDKLAPFVECPPDITVSCEFWFPAEASAGFIPQELDELSPIFGRVLDAYEYNQSDRQPIIIDDPGNNQVSQPHNWGLEGWADDNCDVVIDVRIRIFDDCSGETLPNPKPANAKRLVERTFRATDAFGNVSTCRQLIWVVDFQPFDITDVNCTNANPNDGVIWPCDREFTTCPDEIPVDYPTVFDDNCSIIGIEYDDQVFYFVDNACYKIVRTWSVIDWCQYNPITQSGYWQYIQIIKVTDSDGPVFADCPAGPVTLCVENEGISLPANNQVFLGEDDPQSTRCSVHVRIEHKVVEACSEIVKYDVKVYPNNGSQFLQVIPKTDVPVDSSNMATLVMDTKNSSILAVRQNGLPYNERFCSNYPLPGGDKDYHRVLWTVEDGCGNITTCEYLLRLEDCKKPSPVCINGLSSVVMPSNGEVTIWASDFDASSFDDCTLQEDLKFSFSGNSDHPSAKFACDCSQTTPDYPGQPCFDLSTNGSPSFLVEIWVADEGTDDNCNAQISWSERNKDFCSTFIIVIDNEDYCDNSAPISGGIFTELGEPVEKVRVDLFFSPQGTYYTHYITDKDGLYHLIMQNPTVGWDVVPERLDGPKNGVTTLDLVRIQKHLLGIDPFTSPYQKIAADANNSQSVSALDIVELRKLILGIYTELPANESWRFVDGNFEFENNNVWPFDESIYFEGQDTDKDFVGVKIGDLNATAIANANQLQVRSTSGTLELTIDDQQVREGQELLIPVSAEGADELLGLQFELNFDGLKLLSIEPGVCNFGTEHYAKFEDRVSVSWSSAEPRDISGGAALAYLRVLVMKDGLLGNMLSVSDKESQLVPEAYDGEEEILNLGLRLRSGIQEATDFALYQNEPNPFEEETTISFSLPEAMDGVLAFYDVTGRQVHEVKGSYVEGINRVTVKTSQIGASGLIYYSLTAGEFTATKKMMIIR